MLNLLSAYQMSLEKIDSGRIALNVPNYLGAFEQLGVRLPLIDDLREHFRAELQILYREKYNLRPKIFRTQDEQEYHPEKIQSPIVHENVALSQLMFLLYERLGNLKGVQYQYYTSNEKYDAANLNFSLEPFLNRGSPQEVKKAVQKVLPDDFDPTNDKDFMRYLELQILDIVSNKLAGSDHNFLPHAMIARNNAVEFRNATRKCIRSMGQHYGRLTRSPQAETQGTVVNIKEKLTGLLCALKINELSCEGLERLSYPEVLTVYADEIASVLGTKERTPTSDEQSDIEFASRTSDFIYVGSRYGDCTSKDKKDHEDRDTVDNIFWTVASYGLDIFHQVIELKHKGSPIIKAHIMPCFFYGRLTLHIDAIETVTRIRDYRSATNMIPNEDQDLALMKRREEFLAMIFDEVERIADQMGIELVTCDAFSNTHWVQTSVHRLLPNIYHIRDFDQVYDGTFTRDLAKHILGISVETRAEIQATNLSMSHPDLQLGYKRNYSLRGGTTKLRGI